ncbi:hypothetical protein B0I35DRAFT_479139 [Stachybotrys elegans]|uniref:Uncharacterized protein n=1 Tax=Stachybotrys elegans TaxID=80388 RepID=A0A8K0WS29_9HYPO|nr:hypothetical protein B0I35DRAFT_479139 [Stachybotrys elegans]
MSDWVTENGALRPGTQQNSDPPFASATVPGQRMQSSAPADRFPSPLKVPSAHRAICLRYANGRVWRRLNYLAWCHTQDLPDSCVHPSLLDRKPYES